MSKAKKTLNKIIKNSVQIGDDCTESWNTEQDLQKARIGLSAYNTAIRAIKERRKLL